MAGASEDTISVQVVINALQESSTDLTKLIEDVEKKMNEMGVKEYMEANYFSLFPACATVVTLAKKMNCNSADSLMHTLQDITSKEGDNEELLTALEEFNRIKSIFDDFLQSVDNQLAAEKKETQLPKDLKLEIPGSAQTITLEDLISKKKYTWVVFLRNYFCPACCKHVESLAAAKEKLMDVQCQVILIAPGEAKGVDLFKNDVKCPFEIYLDPSESKEVYLNYGMKKSMRKICGSHTWPLVADYLFTGGRIGKAYEGIRDEPINMGGDIVFDSAGEIMLSNFSKHVFDRLKTSTVLDTLGQ